MNYSNLKTMAIIAEATLLSWKHIFSCINDAYCNPILTQIRHVMLKLSPWPPCHKSLWFYDHYYLCQGVPEQQTRDIIKVAEEKGVGKLDMSEVI